MAKRGWRVQKIDAVRVGGANGSFRDYFQAQIINKSILGFFAPKNSHKVIGETPVFIGGGSLNSDSNQLPSQFSAGGQVPFVGNDDSVKLDKFSEVSVGWYIHSKEILSANVKGQTSDTGGGNPMEDAVLNVPPNPDNAAVSDCLHRLDRPLLVCGRRP